jgi:predicted nucleic-acid-binding protein
MTKFAGSLDTNVLLRLLLNDIPEQRSSVKRLLGQTNNQFVVADTAVIELVFVLYKYYGFNRLQITEVIDGLMSLKEINCNRGLFIAALPLFVSHASLSFEDCCLAVYAQLNDAEPLWTFDKKLASHAESAKLIAL